TPRFIRKWINGDQALEERLHWRHRTVDYLDGRWARAHWQWARLRLHTSLALARWIPTEAVVARACSYANREMAKLAIEERADLYIAQQHHSLPAAAWAAERTGARLAFDAEDLLGDYSQEPWRVHRRIEELYLK